MPSAYVLITFELGYEDKTMSKLNKLTGVEATRLDGAYDIIAKINADSKEILTKKIEVDMKKMDRIQSTVTLIVIEEDQTQRRKEVDCLLSSGYHGSLISSQFLVVPLANIF